MRDVQHMRLGRDARFQFQLEHRRVEWLLTRSQADDVDVGLGPEAELDIPTSVINRQPVFIKDRGAPAL